MPDTLMSAGTLSPSGDEVDLLSALLADPALGRCSYRSLARLLPHVGVQQVAAGTVLYLAGQPATACYLLLSGDMTLTAPSGRKLSLHQPRCGEEAAEVQHYLTTARAAADCTLLSIPSDALQALLAANPKLKTELLLSLSSHLAGEALTLPAAAAPPRKAARTPTIRLVGWLLTLLLPLLVLLLAPQVERALGLERNGTLFLAIFVATVTMWVFSLLDDYIPGLFAVLATLVCGLVPTPVILSGFASDGFMMAMSTLALSVVVVSSGLSYRCMLELLRRLPNQQLWHNLGLFLTGALLTPIIPTANGRVALVAPFLADMADSLRLSPRGLAATRLAASCFGGISLMSATVMTSKSVNFAVYGLLPAQDQAHFQWLAWFFSAAIAALVLCAVYAVGATLWFRNDEAPQLPKALIAAQLQLLGPLKNREWAALGALGFVIVGIVTSSIHKVQPPWLVLTMLLGLLLFGTLRKNEFKEQVDWTFLLYLSGVTGIVGAFSHLGLDKALGGALPALGGLLQSNIEGFILLLFVIVCLIRLLVPINATIVILAAILMPLAELNGVSPWVVGFLILLFAETWFLPYQCSYYLQLRELNQSRPLYDEAGFLRFNAIMNLARLAAAYASLPFWASLGLL